MFFDDTNLIRSLYSGIFEAPLWESFLERLQARLQAQSVAIVLVPAEGGAPTMLQAGGALGERFAAATISARGIARDGRIYSEEDFRQFSDDPAQSSTMPPPRLRLRAVRTSDETGLAAWLVCCGGAGIGAAAGALLGTLSEHLGVALRSYVLLERERYRSDIASDAIQRLSLGWFTLDRQATIIEASEDAEQFFRMGGPLRRGRHDRLVPQSRQLDHDLSLLLKAYESGAQSRPRAFTLSLDPWFNMLVTPAPERRVAGGQSASALVYLSGDRNREADRCDQLVELFGLLPSEARLAWQLAQATSIADAARTLGLTVETARNYSKKIYAKTGARGQAELVRIVLTSVLAMR